VTPVREQGQVSGYMSVRTNPNRAEVEAVGALYRAFKQNAASGTTIYRGLAVPTGLRGKLHALGDISIAKRLAWSMAGLMVLLAGTAWYGPFGLLLSMPMVVWLWIFMHASIVQPLRKAIEMVHALAAGDLSMSIQADSKGEIGMLQGGLHQLNESQIHPARCKGQCRFDPPRHRRDRCG
jgi:aerotaxis receptor